MGKKLLLAALVGGLVIFFWSFISHMFLGLGSVGMSRIENEAAVTTALRANITEPGLYFFPSYDMSLEAGTPEGDAELARWEAEVKRGPQGLMAYIPGGTAVMSPAQLGAELLFDVIAAFFAALILAYGLAEVGFWIRAFSVALIGLVIGFDILGSYWNWYGFPASFVLASTVDATIGWFLAGLAMSRIARP